MRLLLRCSPLVVVLGACGPSETASSNSTDASADAGTETELGTETTVVGTESESESETGEPDPCKKNVVLMGYWPPTNEMLRQWSNNPAQNPAGWTGENWHGHGFDVYAYFPEFPPDGDPTNDNIGDPGAVGSRESDLQVDYQDTSLDFWQIVDTQRPVILITTSRGGDIGWEIEALEGGHGDQNDGDPSLDWTSDGWGLDLYPTQATIDARSWQAISMVRKNVTLPSQLPMQAIFDATSALALTNVEINQGTSGNFLSGFLGLHGLAYNAMVEHNVAAGHIHVGRELPVADAEQLIEATLEAVLSEFPAAGVECPPIGG